MGANTAIFSLVDHLILRSLPVRGLSSLVVVVQVAVSLALVVAAGLFVRTFSHLTQVPLGFDWRDTLLVTIRTPTLQGFERNALYQRVVNAVSAVPWVEAVGGSMNAPLALALNGDFVVSRPGSPPPPDAERISQSDSIMSGTFAALGIPLDAGRDFDRSRHPRYAESDDRERGVCAAVLARPLADRRAADADVSRAGRLFAGYDVGRWSGARLRVSLHPIGRRAHRLPAAGQRTDPVLVTNFYLDVRSTRQPPEQLTRAVSAAILAVNRDIVLTARPMGDEVRDAMAQDRIVAELSGFFGGLALLLAGLGLYGVTSYAVTRRRAEIGIRMALGAAPSGVIRLVLTHVTLRVAVGVIIGAGIALWASKFATALVYGLEPRDPATLAWASLTLAAVGAPAGWLPAYRASRIDPAEVLRES
jgi:putative ABC transport system permease protein